MYMYICICKGLSYKTWAHEGKIIGEGSEGDSGFVASVNGAMKRRSRRASFGVAAAVVPPDELDEHALAVREPWPRLTRLTAPAAPNKSTALTAEEGAIGSCALPSVKPSGLCLWRRTSRQ